MSSREDDVIPLASAGEEKSNDNSVSRSHRSSGRSSRKERSGDKDRRRESKGDDRDRRKDHRDRDRDRSSRDKDRRDGDKKRSPRPSEKDRKSSSKRHHHSSSSSRRSERSSSKGTTATSNSDTVLFGSDDAKAKAKAAGGGERASKPGIERIAENKASDTVLFGSDEDAKAKAKAAGAGRATTPGVERNGPTSSGGDNELRTSKAKSKRSSKPPVGAALGATAIMKKDDSLNKMDAFGVANDPLLDVKGPEESKQKRKSEQAKLDKEEEKKKKRKMAILGILCCLLILIGAILGWIFGTRGGDDDKAPGPGSSSVGDTIAEPSVSPSSSPSNFPSTTPTFLDLFDPPDEEFCLLVSQNRTTEEERAGLDRVEFALTFDVTLETPGDISGPQVLTLAEAIQEKLAPRLLGCAEDDASRRTLETGETAMIRGVAQHQHHRQLTGLGAKRYIIADAFVKGKEIEGTCTKTQFPDLCHQIFIELSVFLKAPIRLLDIILLISEKVEEQLKEEGVDDNNLKKPLRLEFPFFNVQLAGVEEAPPPADPTISPSESPSWSPTLAPVSGPTPPPSARPTIAPSVAPSLVPSTAPSKAPSAAPVTGPSPPPSAAPTGLPSIAPSGKPSVSPSASPTSKPSAFPSAKPTTSPSVSPSGKPSASPSHSPTIVPSASPSAAPSPSPSDPPSPSPSSAPSVCEGCKPEGSCTGTDPNAFKIGCGSCNEKESCHNLEKGGANTIGENSCTVANSCAGATVNSIGDNSCTGTSSCLSNVVNVGDKSCVGEQACAGRNTLEIGSESCVEAGSCSRTTIFPRATLQDLTAGDGSCKCDGCCVCVTKVGDKQCNEIGDCCNAFGRPVAAADLPEGVTVISFTAFTPDTGTVNGSF